MAHRSAQARPHLQRILNDFVVVERQRQAGPMFYEFRPGCIISRNRLGLVHEDQIGRTDTMVPRIAIGIRVDANKLRIASFDSGFFLQLSQRRVFRGFAKFDEAARQGILPLKRRIFSPDQEKPFVDIKHHAVCRYPRLVVLHIDRPLGAR